MEHPPSLTAGLGAVFGGGWARVVRWLPDHLGLREPDTADLDDTTELPTPASGAGQDVEDGG